MGRCIRLTTFDLCHEELILRGGQCLFDSWTATAVAKKVVMAFSHVRFHQVSMCQLEAVRRRIESDEATDDDRPLGDVAANEAIEEVDDFHPDFPLALIFHQYIEDTGEVPDFKQYWEYLTCGPHQDKCYIFFKRLFDELTGYTPRQIERAIRWRLGNAYSSSFRELYTAVWLREHTGLQVHYHLFADIQLQTDLWSGDRLFCLRVPNPKLQRKRDPRTWAGKFHIIQIDIGRQGYGKLWLPTVEQLRIAAGIKPVPGAVTTIRADLRLETELPVVEEGLPAIWTGVAPSISVDQALAQIGASGRPFYSLVLVGASPSRDQIYALLRSGIKVYLFTSAELPDWPDLGPFVVARLLHLQRLKPFGAISPAMVCDGVMDAKQRKTLAAIGDQGERAEHFNWEQYLVEHALWTDNLRVAAGAGTGKTTVMVQRVMYLLHCVPSLLLREVAMITFTKHATEVMRGRLRTALEARYRLTGQARYIAWLEELTFMQISTIPSFARSLLQAVGAKNGYGRNFQIREFNYQRKLFLSKTMDELIKQGRQPAKVRNLLKVPLYKFVDIANGFWDEMNNKGLTGADLAKLDWGSAADDESKDLQRFWPDLFQRAEAKLEAEKHRTNSISLGDLTRELSAISTELAQLRRAGLNIRFLFVDEFQDTDEAQVNLVAAIQLNLGAVLFVVGDIKQSIYRFRGANYTAFDSLKKLLTAGKAMLEPYTLTKNYRTAAPVLSKLAPYFEAWGKEEWLPYGPDDALAGGTQEPGAFALLPSGKKRDRELVMNLIAEAYRLQRETRPERLRRNKPPETVAVLVRTNKEAEMIKQWCTDANIPCEIDRTGGLFKSQAVKHLYALITALLYPQVPEALLNLLDTPYSSIRYPWQNLLPHKGDPAAIRQSLSDHPPHPEWNTFVDRCRLEPVLSVIRSVIEQLQPVQHYFDEQRTAVWAEQPGWSDEVVEAEAKRRASRYQRTVNRVMELLTRTFSEQFVTLYALHAWLKLQIATNRREDEPELTREEQEGRVLCMSVHKAKGDEFTTVIIPFTARGFIQRRSSLILRKPEAHWQAGWLVRVRRNGGDLLYHNNHYEQLSDKEDREVFREETRLLYVALTRTQERLWVVAYKKGDQNWGRLLREVTE